MVVLITFTEPVAWLFSVDAAIVFFYGEVCFANYKKTAYRGKRGKGLTCASVCELRKNLPWLSEIIERQ